MRKKRRVKPAPAKRNGRYHRIRKRRRTRQSTVNSVHSKPLTPSLLDQNRKELSIIISAHNEDATIAEVLKMALALHPKEIIVIENGSTDQTVKMIKKFPVRLFRYKKPLGHDVGRAIGAAKSSGEVLLFVDGDLPISPEQLVPFIQRCYDGADVVLNDLNPLFHKARRIDYVSLAKHYLNDVLLRSDLGFNSLTAVPHAMTRRAALIIGYEHLAIPPKAQAIAVYRGLKVEKAATVDVFLANKIRPAHHLIGEMILGDHIEAIDWLQQHTSKRLNLTDGSRIRAWSNIPYVVKKR